MAQSHETVYIRHRLGLAEVNPSRRHADARNLGRGTSARKAAPARNNSADGEKRRPPETESGRGSGRDAAPGAPGCPWCNGAGMVNGAVDDIDFSFTCVCRGGDEEAVRWLIGDMPRHGDDYSI